MENADEQNRKDNNSSLFHQEGRPRGRAMLTMRVFLDDFRLTRSSRKIDGFKLPGLLVGGLTSEPQHESLCPDQEDPRRLHAAAIIRSQQRCRISEDGSLVVVGFPGGRRREASLLNPPLMTHVEN